MTTMDDFGDDDAGASQDDPDEQADQVTTSAERTALRSFPTGNVVTHTISEDANRINLMTKIKRGTGTRDQDVVKVKVAGDDPEATAQRLNDVLVELVDVPQELRDIQPE